MAKKDKKWKKKTRKINGEDVVVYERTATAKKYTDPKNKETGKTKSIVMQINPTDGMVRFVERKEKKNGDITQNGKTYEDIEIVTEDTFTTGMASGNTSATSGALFGKYFINADEDDEKEKLMEQAQRQILAQLKEDKANKTGNGAGKILEKINDGTYNAYASIKNEQEEPEDDDSESGETDPEVNPDEVFGQDNTAYKRKKYPVGRKGAVYRYPQKIPDLGYDFIKIVAYEYTAGGKKSFSPQTSSSARERIIKEAKQLETIVLPMQPNFSESNAVSWGGDNINPLQLMGANLAQGVIGGIGDMDFSQIQNAFRDLGSDINAALSDETTGPALKAYFAGQAVGANVLGRMAGTTLNPNLELLFKGPNLRTFNFNFKFTPRNAKEANEVKQIIRVFKKNMAVQRSTSNLFLITPNVFTLEYIYNSKGSNAGSTHPYLNTFKPMAMTSLNVNYTPDGTYMTYNGSGALTSTDLQMSFGELEPIYADEFNEGGFENHANMGY